MALPGLSADVLVLICAIYLFAGVSKGIVGLGLPTIGIGIATLFLGLDQALAVATLPVLLTNAYQAVVGGHFGAILRSTWPLLLPAIVFTGVATGLIVRVDKALLTMFLGVILISYALLSLAKPTLRTPARQESWMAPVAGVLTGIVTGVTGSSVVPGALYLQSLALPRDAFVQSLGILFTGTYIGLVVGLGGHSVLNGGNVLASAIAVLPAVAGMAIGMRIRKRIPEDRFRTIFLCAVLLLGAYLIVRSV